MPLNIDWQQILLHIFNLAILTGGLYFLLYAPIKKFIEKREEEYRRLDAETKERLSSAEAMENEAKLRLDGVESEILRMRAKADEELHARADRQIEEAAQKAEKIISDAQKSAQEERKAILRDADNEIISMTKEAAKKMVFNSTDEAYEAFLDAAERDVNDGE